MLFCHIPHSPKPEAQHFFMRDWLLVLLCSGLVITNDDDNNNADSAIVLTALELELTNTNPYGTKAIAVGGSGARTARSSSK